ncbi:MAG: hypothetical protein AB8G11_05240 [Saprospiraceae bacterium]
MAEIVIESVYKNLAIEPEKVYPEMLEAIEEHSWSKFGKALELLNPLIKSIDKTLNTRLGLILQTAYEQHHIKIAERNTYRLIICSAKRLLITILTKSDIDKKAYCKQAFKELQILKQAETKYATINFAEDFSKALDSLEKPEVFNNIIEDIIKQLENL